MRLSGTFFISSAVAAFAAPVIQNPIDTNYTPLQYLQGTLPLPTNGTAFNLGSVSQSVYNDITRYSSLVSLVDCVQKGSLDGDREVFHVLENGVNGFFLKDNQNKELWAVFGDNPTIALLPNLVSYAPKIVLDGLNKVNFSCPDCMVQEGQMLALDLVIKDLPIFIREITLNPDYATFIAGKAFGAGVAALTGNEVSLASNVISLVTFGGAKYADIAMSQYMDQHYGKSINKDLATNSNNTYLRVTSDGDPTPLFPVLLPGFSQSGTNIHIFNDTANVPQIVFRDQWSPQLDGLIVNTLDNTVKQTLKTALDFPTTLLPNMAIFLGNLLCPIKTY